MDPMGFEFRARHAGDASNFDYIAATIYICTHEGGSRFVRMLMARALFLCARAYRGCGARCGTGIKSRIYIYF